MSNIETFLNDLNRLTKERAGDPKSWISCNVIVIEDMEKDAVGIWAKFLALPRPGDGIHGLGVVEGIEHYPSTEEEGGYPAITLFVRRASISRD